jgi:hypothetical protein
MTSPIEQAVVGWFSAPLTTNRCQNLRGVIPRADMDNGFIHRQRRPDWSFSIIRMIGP